MRIRLASLTVLVLTGCRSPGPLPVSDEAVLLELPALHQDELYECGLVSVSMLAAYYGLEIPAEQRELLVARARDEEGLSGAELKALLQGLELETFVFAGSLDRTRTGLYGHVDQGRPLLVMVAERGEPFHYSLFVGYDEPLENVLLLDPVQGPIALATSTFERVWSRSGRFTLLSVPRSPGPGTPPSSPTPEASP